MKTSLLYASNSATQTVTSGDSLNFGSALRKQGCNCALYGGTPMLQGAGYYSIKTNITFTATGAGTATFTLYADGIPVKGATSSYTVADGQTITAHVDAIDKTYCCNPQTITVVVGSAGTVSNVSIIVVKE